MDAPILIVALVDAAVLLVAPAARERLITAVAATAATAFFRKFIRCGPSGSGANGTSLCAGDPYRGNQVPPCGSSVSVPPVSGDVNHFLWELLNRYEPTLACLPPSGSLSGPEGDGLGAGT